MRARNNEIEVAFYRLSQIHISSPFGRWLGLCEWHNSNIWIKCATGSFITSSVHYCVSSIFARCTTVESAAEKIIIELHTDGWRSVARRFFLFFFSGFAVKCISRNDYHFVTVNYLNLNKTEKSQQLDLTDNAGFLRGHNAVASVVDSKGNCSFSGHL